MSSPGKAKNILPAKVSLFSTETCGLDKGSQTQGTGERQRQTEKKEGKNYHSVQLGRKHSEDIKNIREDRCHLIIFSHRRAVCLVKADHSEAVVECSLQSTTSNKTP